MTEFKMVSFNFVYPFFLWFLLVVPLFFLIYFSSFMYHKKKSVVFSNFKALERFYGIEFFSKNFISLYINDERIHLYPEIEQRIKSFHTDKKWNKTVEAIANGARTGNIGDGKIFVIDLPRCIRIRTGEEGAGAIG